MLTTVLIVAGGLLPVVTGLWEHFRHKSNRRAAIQWLRNEIDRLEASEPAHAA